MKVTSINCVAGALPLTIKLYLVLSLCKCVGDAQVLEHGIKWKF